MTAVRLFVCALALLGVVGATGAPGTALAPGTYQFAVHADGKTTARTTVVIANDGTSVTVRETIYFGGDTEKTTRVLDPVTFATISWAGTDGHNGNAVMVTGKGATYSEGATHTSLAIAAPGAPSAVFDFNIAEFATLAAMLHATNATEYNEYCTCIGGFDVKAIAVVPATAARPAAVQPGDVAIGLKAGSETATLWYDPQTFVLRELDFTKEHISYVRI